MVECLFDDCENEAIEGSVACQQCNDILGGTLIEEDDDDFLLSYDELDNES